MGETAVHYIRCIAVAAVVTIVCRIWESSSFEFFILLLSVTAWNATGEYYRDCRNEKYDEIKTLLKSTRDEDEWRSSRPAQDKREWGKW